jgi:glycosyltransferase involved in cell wall biosynthesis
MTQKKRILFVGEASFLNTGFSTYYRELLPRLVATGKYEIAELGSYARPDDPRIAEFIRGRWKFYGVMPTNEEEVRIFQQASPHPRARGQNTNQFGEYKFAGAVADFKPDIVVDIRDWWMLEFQERSIFRPWYKWIVMPTVDAEPQLEEWIQTYENANIVLAYSDYGIHTLRQQSSLAPNGKRSMKIFPKPMRPGVDISAFKPMNRAEVREHWNLASDVPIIGTVMRNQSRKLYPDLIDAFALMKNKFKGDPQVDKAVLLLHTCWPDNAFSYDYPRHVYRLEAYNWMPNHKKGIRGDILQSLFCYACKQTSVTFAMNLHGRPVQDGRIKMPCSYCGKVEASPPNTSIGFGREDLAKLYNLMDLYIQCSICEGDGMPIQEAKACGVPTLVTDYTAMREKGRFPASYSHFKESDITEKNYTCHKGGDVIDVGRYYYEPETSCKRALPSIEDLATKMAAMISNKDNLKALGLEARKCVEDNYDWETLWKQWEYVLDNVSILDRSETWDSPIAHVDEITAIPVPENLNDEQYVSWLYLNVLKYPAVDPEGAKMWVSHLQQGVTREQLMQQFISIGNQQSNNSKMRDQVRIQMGGKPAVSQQSKSQEFV